MTTPRILASLIACCGLVFLSPSVSAAPENARTVELLSLGRALSGVELRQGEQTKSARIPDLPPGLKWKLRGNAPVQIVKPAADAASKDEVLATVTIPADWNDPLVLLVPGAERGKFDVRLFRRDPSPVAGAYEFFNLTPGALALQFGDTAPVMIPAWGQQRFMPKIDRKYRALLKVGVQMSGVGNWTPIKSGIVVIPPESAVRAEVVVAVNGMGRYSGEGEKSHGGPDVFIVENAVPVRPAEVVASR